jgi:ribosomal protein S18 acetylase RimI-like enzyme
MEPTRRGRLQRDSRRYMAMSVRRAERRDGGQLVELLKAADSADYVRSSADDIASALDSDGTERVFVAELSGQLVGFASVQITESFAYTRPTAELTELFVLPGFRRGGIGSQLLSAVIAHSEEQQTLELFARVNKSNSGASKLYESLGFRRAQHDEYRLTYY